MKKNTAMLTEGGIAIALAYVLGQITLFKMPQGGSVTAGQMIPILFYAIKWGVGPGMIAGFAYGIVDALTGGYVLGPAQFMLDYPIAFMCLGLAGIFTKDNKVLKNHEIAIAIFIAIFARFVCHVASGIIFFSENLKGIDAWTNSIRYNGTFLGIEFIITAIVITALHKYFDKFFTKQ